MELVSRIQWLEYIQNALRGLTSDINALPGLLWGPDCEPSVTYEQVQMLIENDLKCINSFVSELITDEKRRIWHDYTEPEPRSMTDAIKEMFDNRELALMSIAISKYISDENCKEPQAVEFELREIVRKLDYLISAESDIRRQPDHTAIMNMNDHQEMNNRHVGLTGAEEITCDNCCESVVFHLRDNKHDFTMGLSTVLECLMFAVQQGDLPKLPLSWLSNADDVCGTGYAENPQYFYADERNYQRKDARS